MRICELFENSDDQKEVSGIFTDSRKIIPGGIFVAINGDKNNGHSFADEAFQKGAVLIVASEQLSKNLPAIYVDDTREALANISRKFYGYPDKSLKLIGVTGTNGKTTVTYLIKAILEADGKRVGVIGTNKAMAGDKELDFESHMPTTPDSLELAQIFTEMKKEQVEWVVMEVSSHALVQKRVHGMEFEVGVFTNLTPDHLDFHKNMEEYFKAKSKLFDISKKAVLNTDTSSGLRLSDSITCPVTSVGIHASKIRAQRITLGSDFVKFTVSEDGQKHTVKLGIPGKFSVYNALSAIGTARALEIGYDSIGAGLLAAENVRGRIELVKTATPYKIFIDYAHTPDGMTNIINTAKGFTKGNVIVLFGCGGDRDASKRAVMGEIAGRLADFSIITSDNPRTENPVEIIEEIKKGTDRTNGEYIIIVNRREAIQYALENAKENDTILLLGKGQETYQIIGRKKYHFDEREIIKEILDNK